MNAATYTNMTHALILAAKAHSEDAHTRVDACLRRGRSHMDYKDFTEFDCTSAEQYIYQEAEHLIEKYDLTITTLDDMVGTTISPLRTAIADLKASPVRDSFRVSQLCVFWSELNGGAKAYDFRAALEAHLGYDVPFTGHNYTGETKTSEIKTIELTVEETGGTPFKTPNAEQLKATIKAVHAVPLTKGFRVELELNDGERIVIKKKGTKAPSMVQLYTFGINGNNRGAGAARYFTFSKSIDAHYRGKGYHLASYAVAIEA